MPELQEATYRAIAGLMHSAIGLSLGASKQTLVASRLAPRLQKLGLNGFDDYLDLIGEQGDAGELQTAVDLLTTNETYFFREPAHFDLLERQLPHEPARSPAVWCAASSFGDEAYSIAMLLSDLQQQGRVGGDWSVLGTDISERVLQSAKLGIYPENRLRNVSPQRLKRYCLRGDGESAGSIQVQPALRGRVRWGWLNLCQPIDGLGLFDVVLLRNVLIYFDAPTQREVMDRVLAHLRPGGLFFIGTAEGRLSCGTPLQTLAPGVFRKVSAPRLA